MPSTIQKLLFIDTNIWLDFYRSRNNAGLKLLERVEKIKDKVIVTYQLESEFKSNRQGVLKQSWENLKPPHDVERPNIVAAARTTKMLAKDITDAKERVKKLKERLEKIIAEPMLYDPVYKVCQRIFHRKGALILKRDDPVRHKIRRRAYKRFLHGCPPRKLGDTSIGDAFNWEWMVQCAIDKNAELVIVSRDTDYGVSFDKEAYINDHLKQEFHERVSKKRKILLYNLLTDALKHFEVAVSKQEVNAEADLVNLKRTLSEVQMQMLKSLQPSQNLDDLGARWLLRTFAGAEPQEDPGSTQNLSLREALTAALIRRRTTER